MFKVYGVCSLPPELIVKFLKRAARKSKANIKVWVPGRKLAENDVVVFMGVESFQSVLRQTMRDKLVFTPVIMDAALNLSLRNFEILDVKRNILAEEVANIVMRGRNILPNTSFFPFKRDKPIYDLIEETQKTSRFLDTYYTLFYTLPKPVQPFVKEIVLNFMVGRTREATFDSKIAKYMPKRNESRAKFDKLLAMVKGTTGQQLRVAIARVLSGKQTAKAVAEKMSLSAFDITYFIKLSVTKQKEDVLVTHATKPQKLPQTSKAKANVKGSVGRSNQAKPPKRRANGGSGIARSNGKRTSGRHGRGSGRPAIPGRGRRARA